MGQQRLAAHPLFNNRKHSSCIATLACMCFLTWGSLCLTFSCPEACSNTSSGCSCSWSCSIVGGPPTSASESSTSAFSHWHHRGAVEDSWTGRSLQGGRSHLNEVINQRHKPTNPLTMYKMFYFSLLPLLSMLVY